VKNCNPAELHPAGKTFAGQALGPIQAWGLSRFLPPPRPGEEPIGAQPPLASLRLELGQRGLKILKSLLSERFSVDYAMDIYGYGHN
jgi:hypothetical protein